MSFALGDVIKKLPLPNVGSVCVVHPGVRDKRRVSEIDLSQPRHEKAFWWRHNEPVTSQLTDPIKWRNNPLELIGISVHINTHSKEFLTQLYRRSTDVHCVWYSCAYQYGLSLNGWHALFCIANNRHGITITTHAIQRHFLIWMTTVRQPAKRRCSCVLTLKYTFLCVYWWTTQRIHNTLIWVDRYLRFVAGIDLPHQGVVDSYSLRQPATNNLARHGERDKPVLNTNEGSFLHALVHEVGHYSERKFLI